MSDDWMSVKVAIAQLAEATSVEAREATAELAELLRDETVRSRIATVVSGLGETPRRNVSMGQGEWESVFELGSGEWHRYGSFSFDDENKWLGIEVNRRDLEVALGSRLVSATAWSAPIASISVEQALTDEQSAEQIPERRKPGPKPNALWPAAIDAVLDQAKKKGLKIPLKWGEKSWIDKRLLDFMADNIQEDEEVPSAASARLYRKQVIDRLQKP